MEAIVVAMMPHCDSAILHKPGACEYCDEFPELQATRELWRLNFSDTNDPDKAPCPSTFQRSAETRDRWPGNRASGKARVVVETMSIGVTASGVPLTVPGSLEGADSRGKRTGVVRVGDLEFNTVSEVVALVSALQRVRDTAFPTSGFHR